ncbi:MAG: MATE family efflux transporter, partial [Cetobacterium sp.]
IIGYSFVAYRMLFAGLAQGIQPIVSFNFGKHNYRKVLEILRYSHKFCLLATILAFILVKVFALDIVKIFTNESELFEYTRNGLVLYCSAIVFVGANFMNISYLQAMNKSLLANFISICRGIVFMGIGIMTLPKILGVNGIWLALPLADVLTFILTITIFKVLNINRNLKKL